MPSHDEGAVRASLQDLTHQGETLTAAQGATQQSGKALPTECDVWKLGLLWRCANESHLHMLNHTLTNTHAQSWLQHVHLNTCTKIYTDLQSYKYLLHLIFHFSDTSTMSQRSKETYSMIHLLSKLQSPQEYPAGKKSFIFCYKHFHQLLQLKNAFYTPVKPCSWKSFILYVIPTIINGDGL